MTFIDQFLDHFDLFGNVLYCTRLDMGSQTIQKLAICVKFIPPLRREFF